MEVAPTRGASVSQFLRTDRGPAHKVL